MRAALLAISVMSIAAAAVVGVASCDKMGGGFKSKNPSASSTNPSATSTSSNTSSAPPTASVAAIPPASDGSTPSRPEHLVLRVAYLVDAGQSESSMMELEREGTFKLERRGGDLGADAKDLGSLCTGTLSPDVGGAIWKAVDAAAFVPSESGFSKPIQAPRQQQQVTQQGRYSITRMLADLSMVPADENGAKALVQPIRAAISTAEKQSASSGTCTKLPRR